MSDDLAEWWQHPAVIERFTGAGATGDVLAAPVDVVGFVDDETRLVRNPQGEEVVSSARLFLPVDTADVPVRSRVTLGDPFAGRAVTEVVAFSRHVSTDGPSHLELALA